jgi:hypothetical protein
MPLRTDSSLVLIGKGEMQFSFDTDERCFWERIQTTEKSFNRVIIGAVPQLIASGMDVDAFARRFV